MLSPTLCRDYKENHLSNHTPLHNIASLLTYDIYPYYKENTKKEIRIC